MLAASIVQDTFAGEAIEGKGGEEETNRDNFYFYFYRSGKKVFRFLALGFHSQITHARMHIRNRRTYIYIYYIPPPLTVHFSMTRSVRYQPILHSPLLS